MTRSFLLLILIASALSCKKKSEPLPDLTSKLVGSYKYPAVDYPDAMTSFEGSLYRRQLTVTPVDRTTLKVNDFNSITFYSLSYPYRRIDSSSYNMIVKLEKDDEFSYETRSIGQGVNGPFEKIHKVQAILKDGGINFRVKSNTPDPNVWYSDSLFMKRK